MDEEEWAMNKSATRTKFKVTKQKIEYEFEAAEEGGYVVTVPLYPSCMSQGDTFEETLANIEDALVGCLLAAREQNLPITRALEPILHQKVTTKYAGVTPRLSYGKFPSMTTL